MSSASQTLDQVQPGYSCTVQKVQSCKTPLARRLMEMGMLPGTEVCVTRKAPLRDPIELQLRGYSLSIRKSDAACIEVGQIVSQATRTKKTNPRLLPFVASK